MKLNNNPFRTSSAIVSFTVLASFLAAILAASPSLTSASAIRKPKILPRDIIVDTSREIGATCLYSSPLTCWSGCCFEGKCAEWSKCFSRPAPGVPGAPCTASDRAQCSTGCCVNGVCADSAACWGDASPQVSFTYGSKALTVSQSDDPEFPYRIEFGSADVFANFYSDVGNVDAVGRVTGSKLSRAFGGGVLPVAGVLVSQHNGAGDVMVPISAKVYLHEDPPYVLAKPVDSLPGVFASLAGLPALNLDQSSQTNLTSPLLYLRNCPDNVPFMCCSGRCNHDGCFPPRNICPGGSNTSNPTCETFNVDEACPSNVVGEVLAPSCWDWGAYTCVACHDSWINDRCSEKYGSNCPDGRCGNSWRVAYIYNFGCCEGFKMTLHGNDCLYFHQKDSRCWARKS